MPENSLTDPNPKALNVRRTAHVKAMVLLEDAAFKAVRAANRDTGASEELKKLAARCSLLLEKLS